MCQVDTAAQGLDHAHLEARAVVEPGREFDQSALGLATEKDDTVVGRDAELPLGSGVQADRRVEADGEVLAIADRAAAGCEEGEEQGEEKWEPERSHGGRVAD